MYRWRKLSKEQRVEVLEQRKERKHPWHSPPHFQTDPCKRYFFTAACYEHAPIIGSSAKRMTAFEERLTAVAENYSKALLSWVVLPNHYHFLVRANEPFTLLSELGKLHGRTSFEWNGEENSRGRKVWFAATETAIKGRRHFGATLNYIHHNPVKHGYVDRWTEWPWSSANDYLREVGVEKATRDWREYTIERFGEGWDD